MQSLVIVTLHAFLLGRMSEWLYFILQNCVVFYTAQLQKQTKSIIQVIKITKL